MNCDIKNITCTNFKKYGYVIDYDSSEESFQVILKENSKVGWRIAVSKITANNIKKIARHPNSMESFEPLAGVTLLYVATVDNIENFQVFLLDRPVCLKKNIWHATFSLSEYSLVKICENAEVGSEEYKLNEPITIKIDNQ